MAARSLKGCCVCAEQAPKYRCPGCRLRYCSVPCCKKHKETCVPKSKPVAEAAFPEISSVFRDYTLSEREDDGVYTEGILCEDDESDKVPLEKLKRLGESKEMKDLLLNPHLAQLLVTIDKAEEKGSVMKKYMQEPLLVEFADCCLRIVEPPKNTNVLPLEEVKLQDIQELMLQ
ncbi:hypothetical protein NDU88_002400 [Pleurodeles waltl]|uniref:Zinc finger HIT domain-containing protein 3 n=1 Tax=Pleurodeles waltl TaxID=8319 RepID=A0AAV7UB27_PLEWA|nr:hypothetical protein NDU88_002400 [Pleurodeles waltl]